MGELAVKVVESSFLKPAQTDQMYGVAALACSSAMYIDDVHEFLGGPERFFIAQTDPSSEILDPNGRRGNNQEYHAAKTALVYDGDVLLGWLSTRHNVSGGGGPEDPHNMSREARLERGLKRLPFSGFNYLYIDGMYVRPDHQGEGIGTSMIDRMTWFRNSAFPWLKLAVYFYPDIYIGPTIDMRAKLEKINFEVTDDVMKTIPGLGDVRRLRMQNSSVYDFRQRVFGKLDSKQAQ